MAPHGSGGVSSVRQSLVGVEHARAVDGCRPDCPTQCNVDAAVWLARLRTFRDFAFRVALGNYLNHTGLEGTSLESAASDACGTISHGTLQPSARSSYFVLPEALLYARNSCVPSVAVIHAVLNLCLAVCTTMCCHAGGTRSSSATPRVTFVSREGWRRGILNQPQVLDFIT